MIVAIFMTALMLSNVSFGQQRYMSSQGMLNPYLFNPAYAGMDFTLDLNVNIRNQYNGLSGNPESQSISGQLPIYLVGGGAGFIFENESLGAYRKTSLNISGNKIFDSSTGLLGIGLSIGLAQLSIDGSQLVTPGGVYEGNIINHNDPILNGVNATGITPQWSAGAFYKSKHIDIGVSVHQLPESNVSIENTSLNLIPHSDLFIQYKTKLNDAWLIKPSIAVRTDYNLVQTDISVLGYYNGSIFGGMLLRGYDSKSLDAVAIVAGTSLNEHITVSYSYDIGVSTLKRVNEGTHEILLNYSLNRLLGAGVAPKIIYNPRNL